MKIVVVDGFTANPGDLSWEPLQALGECVVYDRTSEAEMVERCAGATAVITNKGVLSRSTLEQLPDLKYIGVAATGYNVVDIEAARESGITVTNVPAYSTASVAQLVFALILELAQGVKTHADSVEAGEWQECADFSYWKQPLVELEGRTLGIIGFGSIGEAVARIGTAFGMRVLAHRRQWRGEPPTGVTATGLEEVLAESDVLSLHCPLTDETHHLIDAGTLSRMKPGAWLINTGRGPLIDEAAVAEALRTGTLGGAGLDVLSVEPPQTGSPLIGAPNCRITPHIGWATAEARSRLIDQVAANLAAHVAGTALHVVS